jgi:hypothetical protein
MTGSDRRRWRGGRWSLRRCTLAVMLLCFGASFQGTASAAAAKSACAPAPDFVDESLELPHVQAALAARDRLQVLFLQSPSDRRGSSTARKGWEFEDRLQHWLRRSWDAGAIDITVLQQTEWTAVQWAASLPMLLERHEPELLIWDIGSTDARLGTDLGDFGDAIEQGIDATSASGADLILLEPEYRAEFGMWVDAQPYLELLQQVVRGYPVTLFPRNRITREWRHEADAPAEQYASKSATTKQMNDCLAQLLVGLIKRSVNSERARAIPKVFPDLW